MNRKERKGREDEAVRSTATNVKLKSSNLKRKERKGREDHG